MRLSETNMPRFRLVSEAEVKVQIEKTRGPQGPAGPTGADGYSPTIELNRVSGGVQIRVRNKNGEDIETVYDGRNGTGEGGGGFDYRIGRGLKVTDGDTLEVDTADVVEEDNTLPITSAAVYETVGNINALLATI